MKTIPVAACGDDWVNPQEVQTLLSTVSPGESVTFDLRSEGPSLHALGIVNSVIKWCTDLGIDHHTITVTNWSNSVESVPFRRGNQHLVSHFFWLSEQYQHCCQKHRSAQRLFGYFVGRRTVPRCVMLQQVQQQYSDRFLLSMMSTVASFKFSDLDPLESWTNADQFHYWWNSANIPSLDGCAVRDQFQSDINTNGSLLSNWYHAFDVELVAETYTHGETFFPTEKTVRPIVGGKSMLVYGPRNYLARLRDLGFQTWHNVWDESYDQLQGPERWAAMKTVIDDLVHRDQQQLYQQCWPLTQHNRRQLARIIAQYRPL